MFGGLARSVLAALMALAFCCEAWAACPDEERLLGSDREAKQYASYLPFTRSIGVAGVVEGSLAESTAAAGVPPAAMLAALKAFAAFLDIDREVRDGDRFYVRYQQTFTLEGAPVGVGRVIWAELRLADRRTVGIYRFRPRDGPEEFWTNNAMATETPQLRLPVDVVLISSGFGLRVDPFDQPAMRGMGMGPLGAPTSFGGLTAGPLLKNVNAATPLGRSLGLAPNANSGASGGFFVRPHFGGYAMHEGIDLVAPPGTPIYAAGDGRVMGAEPKGRYGNWVEIEHSGGLATVYGHLSGFAPGIVAGAEVRRGDVIGYVGTTGRTTGPHLHFELRVNGRPINPMANGAIRRQRLSRVDLVAFHKAVAGYHAERRLEEMAH
jgi:murein DD-endopeptidase MepM/ murein hydrolase activator NlpD